jgi:hypothetical protein
MWVVGPILALGLVWAMMEEVNTFRTLETEGGAAPVGIWSSFLYDLGGIEGIVVGHMVFICLVLFFAGVLGWRGFKPREFRKSNVK